MTAPAGSAPAVSAAPAGSAPAVSAGPGAGQRIGIMGGTFDPIHHGHLVAASEVRSRFALDEVLFVPTGQPWQKDRPDISAAEDRYLMTVIATASNPDFAVSRSDVDRPGPTYTVDTLRAVRDQYGPAAELFFITGSDALTQILSWHDADALFELAHFIGCSRPGHPLSADGLPADRVTLLEIPALTISSTGIRGRVAGGEPIWYLVPDGVVQYVAKRGLYHRGGHPTDPTVAAADRLSPTADVSPIAQPAPERTPCPLPTAH